ERTGPPAPGGLNTTTVWPRFLDMPSARSRAATSADEPAGNSTVISIGPFFGKGGSCASTEPVKVKSSKLASTARAPIARITDLRLILGENFRNFDPTSLAC